MLLHRQSGRRPQRPPLTSQGNVQYRLKTPYRDGTACVTFEPLDFITRFAALVSEPRLNLTRDAVTTASQRNAAMTWAQRLKRVLRIEICQHSSGPVLQIYRESRRSNASFHVYRRSTVGRSLPVSLDPPESH